MADKHFYSTGNDINAIMLAANTFIKLEPPREVDFYVEGGIVFSIWVIIRDKATKRKRTIDYNIDPNLVKYNVSGRRAMTRINGVPWFFGENW